MARKTSPRLDRRETLLWVEFAIFAALQIYFIYEMVRSAIASL
ncbi:hypothetical protein [Erythrobacter aureus]|nr:hypothetical protein [Erythrobacter aureus]